MSGAALTRRVNEILAGHGLRWCSRCAPAGEHAEEMRRIVETGPRRHPAIKPIDDFPQWGQRLSPWCRDCKNAYHRELVAGRGPAHRRAEVAERYAQMKADPVRLAAARERWREHQRLRRERAKADPALAARMRANQRRHRDRILADPVRHQEWKDAKRMDYRLRKEREGQVLTPTGKRAPEDVFMPVVPVEPFAEWLDEQGPLVGVAAQTGLPERRLREMRNRAQRFVAVDTVDRALLRLGGGLRFGDLYPDVPLVVRANGAGDVFGLDEMGERR